VRPHRRYFRIPRPFISYVILQIPTVSFWIKESFLNKSDSTLHFIITQEVLTFLEKVAKLNVVTEILKFEDLW
jgi:hypothetical protein